VCIVLVITSHVVVALLAYMLTLPHTMYGNVADVIAGLIGWLVGWFVGHTDILW